MGEYAPHVGTLCTQRLTFLSTVVWAKQTVSVLALTPSQGMEENAQPAALHARLSCPALGDLSAFVTW